MSYKFKFVTTSGTEDTTLPDYTDSVRVYHPDGWHVEIAPRRSDGEITIYVDRRMVLQPIATNCIRIKSE